MNDSPRINGLIVKKPHENAPDFVIVNLSFNSTDFSEFLRNNSKNGWFNAQVCISKDGKWYPKSSTYEPPKSKSITEAKEKIDAILSPIKEVDDDEDINPEDIPF